MTPESAEARSARERRAYPVQTERKKTETRDERPDKLELRGKKQKEH